MTGAATPQRRAEPQEMRRHLPAAPVGRAPSDEASASGTVRIVRAGRTRSLVRHRVEDASAELALVVVHDGSLWCRQRGAEAEAGAGDVLSLVLTEPFVLRPAPGSRVTSVQVSRAGLEERGIETNRFAGLAWEPDAHLEPLVALAAKVTTDADGRPVTAYLARAILELVAGVLSAHQDVLALSESPEDHLRQRIINLVRAGYTDPAVDVAWIATQLGMSRRYAHRLFEGSETSIASLLRSRRLEHAENLLRTGAVDLPIARVATLSGFRSADTFARAFRGQFGVAPAEYRARLYD